MQKFGLGKKKEGDEDSGRLALFGSRSKNKSPAPPSYAPSNGPPDPYSQAKINPGILPGSQQFGSQRPPASAGRGLPSGPAIRKGYGDIADSGPVENNPKFAAPSGGYGTGGGYGNDKFGNQGGYGQAKFGSDPYNSGMPAGVNSRSRPGGYGGLGRSNSIETTSTEVNREELFGGARERMQQGRTNGYGEPPAYGTDSTQAAAPSQDRSYGAYGDRQLTAEEEAEEDVEATKQEIKFLKQQDVASTRNALRIATEAEEVGRGTLARLGAQGERLHNTDRNLDLARNHQDVAEQKAKELKIANRSMFRMHVDNPFTKGGRERRDQEILDKHREDREQREVTRQAAYEAEQRLNQNFQRIGAAEAGGAKSKSSLAERARYQFEPDSEDDNMEDEIDENLNQLSKVTGRLHSLAKAQGAELDEHNKLLKGLAEKSDRVDDQLAMNRKRLERIH